MKDDPTNSRFAEIKRLLREKPFVPFLLRSGNNDIEVTHPNAVAFHPEVPFLTVYASMEVYELPVEKISFVQRQQVH